MKKKFALMGIAGILVLAMAVGGTLAALNTNTEGNAGTGVAQVVTKNVVVTTTGLTEFGEAVEGLKPTPGGTISCPASVNNAAEDGYDIYAMVTIYKIWTGDDALDGKMVTINRVIGEGAKDSWITVYSDDEQLILCYKYPIKNQESSTNFVDSISFSSDMNNDYTDQDLELTFEVRAVQANSGVDAMAAEWGYFPTIAEDGTITALSETRPASAVAPDVSDSTDSSEGGNE